MRIIYNKEKGTLKMFGTVLYGDGVIISVILEELANELETDFLTINLHTEGGSVFDGDLIRETLSNLPCPTQLNIIGLCASIGTCIMLGADKISITPTGMLMTHSAKAMLYGDKKQLKSTAVLLEKIEKNLLVGYANKMNKRVTEVEYLLDGDNWFNAKEAKKIGLVDEIISKQKAKKLTEKVTENDSKDEDLQNRGIKELSLVNCIDTKDIEIEKYKNIKTHYNMLKFNSKNAKVENLRKLIAEKSKEQFQLISDLRKLTNVDIGAIEAGQVLSLTDSEGTEVETNLEGNWEISQGGKEYTVVVDSNNTITEILEEEEGGGGDPETDPEDKKDPDNKDDKDKTIEDLKNRLENVENEFKKATTNGANNFKTQANDLKNDTITVAEAIALTVEELNKEKK